MTPTRLLTAAAAAFALLVLAGCAASAPTASTAPTAAPTATAAGPCAGVTVSVDPGKLAVPASARTSACVPATGPIAASAALTAAKVATVGTRAYGDQVVCRVNGIPGPDLNIPAPDGSTYHETCEGMPASFAYWALWVKPAGGAWGYAQEGLATLQVKPGESLELMFTLNGVPASPAP